MPPTKREIDNWMQRQAKVVQSDPTLLRLVTSAVVSTERLTGLRMGPILTTTPTFAQRSDGSDAGMVSAFEWGDDGPGFEDCSDELSRLSVSRDDVAGSHATAERDSEGAVTGRP